MKQLNKQLKEENNLLKIKIDLLLDMVSILFKQLTHPLFGYFNSICNFVQRPACIVRTYRCWQPNSLSVAIYRFSCLTYVA